MSPGWNLGNSFDGSPNVTSWGNPAPTQALIDAVHTAGFKTLRLPVTWTDHIGAAPAYTIDSAWMAQVAQTAQWAVDAGMYVFVNTHHEADGKGGWVGFPSSTTAAQSVAAEVKAVWTQIASAFKSFDSRLMFECFNEPNEAGSNDPQSQADLNLYLEACVNAIRGTGGANATRIVMIQPAAKHCHAYAGTSPRTPDCSRRQSRLIGVSRVLRRPNRDHVVPVNARDGRVPAQRARDEADLRSPQN